MMTVKIRQALKAKDDLKTDPSLKHVSIPEGNEEDVLRSFNCSISEQLMKTNVEKQKETTMADLCDAMDKAARNTLQLKEPLGKRASRHPELLPFIEARLQATRATRNYDYEGVKSITKELKQKARQIITKQQVDTFKDNDWDPVKYAKNGYNITKYARTQIPKHTKMTNIRGELVPDNLRAETQAEYVEQAQWTNQRH